MSSWDCTPAATNRRNYNVDCIRAVKERFYHDGTEVAARRGIYRSFTGAAKEGRYCDCTGGFDRGFTRAARRKVESLLLWYLRRRKENESAVLLGLLRERD